MKRQVVPARRLVDIGVIPKFVEVNDKVAFVFQNADDRSDFYDLLDRQYDEDWLRHQMMHEAIFNNRGIQSWGGVPGDPYAIAYIVCDVELFKEKIKPFIEQES